MSPVNNRQLRVMTKTLAASLPDYVARRCVCCGRAIRVGQTFYLVTKAWRHRRCL